MQNFDQRLQALSPEKRKLMERALKNRKSAQLFEDGVSDHFNFTSIELAARKEYYLLSSAQKRLFILDQLEEPGVLYNMSVVTIIEGDLDRNRLDESFRRIIKRHEVLRTSFLLIDGEPVQRIHAEVDFRMAYISLEGELEEQKKEEKIRKILQDSIRPFSLDEAPLFRVSLIRVTERKHVLLYDMHHIISDGVSVNILIQELVRLYHGEELPELRLQYKDFSEWQNALFQSGKIARQEEYWRQQFAGEIPVLNLPTDFPRPTIQSFEGGHVDFAVENELASRLKQIADTSGVSLYMLLLAAWFVLLAKYSGEKEIIVGSPTAGRRHPDLESIIGVFINTLALKCRPGADKSFAEFLLEVKETTVAAQENQDYQFEELISKLNLKRDLGRNPLFDTMFNFLNFGQPKIHTANLVFRPYPFEFSTSKFDLTLTGYEENGGLQFSLEYVTRLFKKGSIKRMSEHYKHILRQVAHKPDELLKNFSLVTAAEKKQLINDFNNTHAHYAREMTVHQMFEAQVARTPGNESLVFGNQTITYQQLNTKANQLARVLRERGVKSDCIVGIMVDRSLEMIIGIMGVLKAGGAYLPLDPSYPDNRVKYMLEDSAAGILLTQTHLAGHAGFQGEVLDLAEESLYAGDSADLANIAYPDDLAYVIYTSGSTGQPKGVMIQHRAVLNFCQGVLERIDFSSHRRILALTTLSFDIFVLETLLPLMAGLTVVIAGKEEQGDPEQLSDFIGKSKVEILQATPSRMQMLLNSGHSLCLQHVQKILVGGEAFPDSLLQDVKKVTQARIYNMYGPTETTVWSAIKDLTETTEINLGKPIANTQIYIVDRNFNLQPIGVPGEIMIGGDGLARGYLNRPDLTAERFVPDPFGDEPDGTDPNVGANNDGVNHDGVNNDIGANKDSPLQVTRLYKTGDLARWLPNGEIQFFGRVDHQVKVRGFRIELGEIEAKLLQHPVIKEAAVIVRKRENENYICSYLVLEKDLIVMEIRQFLLTDLPDYMIPSYFVKMEKLPLTPNGKVDRNTLPDPEGSFDTGTEYVPPRNEIETLMAQVWQAVLGVERIGIDDDFFLSGGNSLLVIKLEVEMAKHQLPVQGKEIFKHSTIRQLSEMLTRQTEGEDSAGEPPKREDGYANSVSDDSAILIAGIEPFRDLFYKNCFFNSAFPVVLHFGRSILPMLVNDLIQYRYDPTGEKMKLNVTYINRRPVTDLLEREGIYVESKPGSDNLLHDIRQAVLAKRPVILWVDCFYESIRMDMYQKIHWPHTLLVYGYDDVKKVCHIIEHRHKDNLTYEKRVLSYTDVENSFYGFISHFQQTKADPVFYEFYPGYEMTGNVDRTEEYRAVLRENMLEYEEIIRDSLRSVELFHDDFACLVKERDKLDGALGEVIQGLNDIINGKTVERYKLYHLFGEESVFYQRLSEILDAWSSIRGQLAKYLYQQDYDAYTMTQMVRSVKQIVKLETRYLVAWKEES